MAWPVCKQNKKPEKIKAMDEKLTDPTRQMLSMLAHDLRNPINNIIGFSNLVEELTDECQNPALAQYINIIRQEAEHANRLINSITEWGRNHQINVTIQEQIEFSRIIDSAKKDHEAYCVGA